MCTFPESAQYRTVDENGYSYIEETNTIPQSFLYTSPDSFPQMPGWPKNLHARGYGVCLADINQDEYLEILVGSRNGSFYIWDYQGDYLPGWPKTGLDSIVAKPAVADIDPGYPGLEILVAETLLYLWTVQGVEFRPYMVEWGTWFHDNWNTGWFHPEAPQNLNATRSPTSIYLIWDANTESDIAGYNVYRSEISGGPYSQINDILITGTDYDDVPPSSGTLYYYCVTAQIKACTESRLSDEVSGSLGIEEYVNQPISLFSVSPNPFSDVVNFDIPSKQSLTIKIYDCKGALVDIIEGTGSVQWCPGKHLPAGIYFGEMTIAENKIINKIIKLN